MSSINNVSSYLQSVLTSTLQSAGVTQNSSNTSQVSQAADNSNLSPLAQLMNTLHELQQSNPTKYQQVTQQIAANLQSAAQTAQSQGNTAAANQLNQLSQDFTTASQTGQLPNANDLAKAHGHHHHHHSHGGSESSSSTDTTSTSSTSDTQTQRSLNPMSIIWNTLSQAGVTTPNS